MRYDRARALRDRLTADIAALTAQAEAANAADHDPQALPAELARREALKARTGRRGRPPKPPDDAPPPDRQSNLTDPDSALMRRSSAHEHARPTTPRPWSAPRARSSSWPPTWSPPRPMRRALPPPCWAWKPPSGCRGRSWPTPAMPAVRRSPTCKRRAGCRHHQERHGVHPLPPARHPQRRRGVAPGRTRLQLPTHQPHAGHMITPATRSSQTTPCPIRQAARVLSQKFAWLEFVLAWACSGHRSARCWPGCRRPTWSSGTAWDWRCAAQ